MAARKKPKRAAAPVATVNPLPQGRQEFTDGYLEWEAFDEDGESEEGTGDVTAAVVDEDELVLNLDYSDWSYIVRLEKKGEQWEGTFKRMEGGRLDQVGRCRATEGRADSGERMFEGRWFENDTSYKWKLVLPRPCGALEEGRQVQAARAAWRATRPILPPEAAPVGRAHRRGHGRARRRADDVEGTPGRARQPEALAEVAVSPEQTASSQLGPRRLWR
jgi:hypothetical protein